MCNFRFMFKTTRMETENFSYSLDSFLASFLFYYFKILTWIDKFNIEIEHDHFKCSKNMEKLKHKGKVKHLIGDQWICQISGEKGNLHLLHEVINSIAIRHILSLAHTHTQDTHHIHLIRRRAGLDRYNAKKRERRVIQRSHRHIRLNTHEFVSPLHMLYVCEILHKQMCTKTGTHTHTLSIHGHTHISSTDSFISISLCSTNACHHFHMCTRSSCIPNLCVRRAVYVYT